MPRFFTGGAAATAVAVASPPTQRGPPRRTRSCCSCACSRATSVGVSSTAYARAHRRAGGWAERGRISWVSPCIQPHARGRGRGGLVSRAPRNGVGAEGSTSDVTAPSFGQRVERRQKHHVCSLSPSAAARVRARPPASLLSTAAPSARLIRLSKSSRLQARITKFANHDLSPQGPRPCRNTVTRCKRAGSARLVSRGCPCPGCAQSPPGNGRGHAA